MIICLQIFNEDDGKNYDLGDVVPPKYIHQPELGEAELSDLITDLWGKWREEVPQPDADSQFVDWLIEKGWTRSDEVVYTICVNEP